MEIKGHKLASFAKQKRRYFQHLETASSIWKGNKDHVCVRECECVCVCVCVCMCLREILWRKKSGEKDKFPSNYFETLLGTVPQFFFTAVIGIVFGRIS